MHESFEEKHHRHKNCSKESSISPKPLRQGILSSVWNSSTYHHLFYHLPPPIWSSIGRLLAMERKLGLRYWSALCPALSVSQIDRVREREANTDRCSWIDRAHRSTWPWAHTCAHSYVQMYPKLVRNVPKDTYPAQERKQSGQSFLITAASRLSSQAIQVFPATQTQTPTHSWAFFKGNT